ncbi:Putative aspartic peptidase A1 family, aspartic peptidase domain superfamily [Colletotrichum destructivum]|uniref:Aspartic peptidase A1 family, aspartic peptidase domain superfamily n=1 Tax=Colletotrichum destructivum TaxID=34406 RepID=A0AAX4IFX2_9PEZI|nr:Putative aspartic peptidase A1 family, aspartic peptidase domain superfamily [Colletotrichum destructivum]
MRSAILVHLSLLFTSTHAFFYWPSPDCLANGDCTLPTRRQLNDQDALGWDGVEESSIEGPEPQRVAREVRRLVRKYARFQSAAVRENASKSKRESQYRIIKAADTTLKNAASVAQDGTDFSYFAQVKLGNKEKPLWMLMDTGAGTSWVMGSSCKSSACEKHGSFGPADSGTYRPNGEDFSVSYGSGAVKGEKVTDTVSFAGMKLDFGFGVANETSEDFNHFPFDGILGLSMAGGETENFMQVVKNSTQLPANIFCVYLNRAADGPNTSEISFGVCNPDKYTGDITYTGVGNDLGDWAVPLDGIAYDGLKSGAAGKLAYIDTGTSYVFGPKDDVALFHKNIPGSTADEEGTSYKVPCDSDKDVTFSFSNVSYVISAKDWRGGPGKDGTCTSNIYGHEVVAGAWLLGDVFLKNVYAVFDKDQKRIGFAKRVDPPPVTTTTSIDSTATPPAVNNPGQGDAVPTSGPALGLGGHETATGEAAAAETSPVSQSGAASSAALTRVKAAAAASLCVAALLGLH